MSKKGENLPIWKGHETMTKTHAYISYGMQLQNHSLTFFHKKKSLRSATSILSCSPMVYNTTASLDKLTYTDYVDFGKCQDRFGSFSWTKNDSNYLDIKLKVFEREDKIAEFRLRQNLSMREAHFNQFIRQRNQLVVAADNISQRTEFVSSSSMYTVQRHGGATEACAQGNWRCRSPKQRGFCDTAAIQGGQKRDFLCSNSSIRAEEAGRNFLTNCVSQLKI